MTEAATAPAAAPETTAPAAAPAAAPETTPAAAAETPAASPAKWWEGLSDSHKGFLTPKGLTMDDPMAALPKLIDIASNAEKRIGKGLDAIIDKPGKDQSVQDWLKANSAALGLPDKEDAYTVAPPDFWPKEAKWDGELEAQARKLAFDNAVPPGVHQAYVGLFAQKMKAMNDAAEAGLAQARTDMMADLRRDFGDKTDATITGAKQAAQFFAEKAGLDGKAIEAIGQVLSDKIGDAGTIRFMAAIREAMGEDSAVALGKGGPLTMTPADARAELAKLQAPGGDYFEAVKTRNLAKIDELKPKVAQLSKIAAG